MKSLGAFKLEVSYLFYEGELGVAFIGCTERKGFQILLVEPGYLNVSNL